MGFTQRQLESYVGKSVPDLIGPGCRLLFAGINPGLWTAATQTHFAHPSNRFYPALQRAGLIDRPIDPAAGMTPDDRAYFLQRGIGISNLFHQATRTAAEITTTDLRSGAGRLTELVQERRPRVVAVAGITAYRTAFGRRNAATGLQPQPIGSAELWVVPNPSGLNAHETVESLARWYRIVGEAAGLV